MPGYDFLDPERDSFRPPAIPTLVACLHCQEEYESYRIEWRIETDGDGRPHGFWCCPIPGCDGKGFFFDIFPVDPDYQDERGGWVTDDDEDEGRPEEGETPGDLDGDEDESIPW
jgi:hypothetical protein